MMSEENKTLDALIEMEKKSNKKVGNIQINKNESLYHDFNKELLGYGGSLYKDTLKFQVLPMNTESIKVYSSMDEENIDSMNEGILHIISNHLRITDGNRKVETLENLHEYDRFPALLLIHRYTGGTNNIVASLVCDHGHETKENVRPELFCYREITEKAKSLFNPKTGTFDLNLKSGKKLIYKPLSLNDSMNVMEFIQLKSQQNDPTETSFGICAGFFMHTRKLDETMEEVYQRYLVDTSDSLIASVMLDFVQNQCKLGMESRLETPCKHKLAGNKVCGRLKNRFTELTGIKGLFLVPNVTDEY